MVNLKSLKFLTIIFFIFASFYININAYAQTIEDHESYQNYINTEIRDTHILYLHLLQSEINGEVLNSANISYFEENNRIYVVAQSLIKTNKNFEAIRSDVENTMSRLSKESEWISLSRSNIWSSMINDSQKSTSWTITDLTSNSKMEIVIYYLINEKEIIVSTVPHQTIPNN